MEVGNYWHCRDQSTVADGIIYMGMRIIIPPSLREQTLKLIHASHLGLVKCGERAREVMYWPGLNSDIEMTVKGCSKCAETRNQQCAKLQMPAPTPELRYIMVGCDLFDFQSKKYVLFVDYYSNYINVVELSPETTDSVIAAMKSVFACHCIPCKLWTDNGPQFSSLEFRSFCEIYGIQQELFPEF